MDHKLLKVKQAARYLSLSERTVHSLTKSGRLPVVRISRGAVRYDLDDLNDFIAKAKNERLD